MEENDIVIDEIKCHIGRTPLPMPGNALESLLINYPEDTIDNFEITLQLNNDHIAEIDNLYKECKTDYDKIFVLNEYLADLMYLYGIPEITDFWEEVEVKFDDKK